MIVKNIVKFVPVLCLSFSSFLSQAHMQIDSFLPQLLKRHINLNISEEPFDATTWQELSLVAQGAEYPIHIKLRRPMSWIEEKGAAVGQTIELNLPEVGVVGQATVHTISDIDPNRWGQRRTIISAVAHQASHATRIHLSHPSYPALDLTPDHLIWSVTSNQWVHASDLNAGDEIATTRGVDVVRDITQLKGLHRIDNIELDQANAYQIWSKRVEPIQVEPAQSFK